MSKHSDPWSARQQRHLAAISEYSTDIRHVSGKNNVVADALSRTPAPTLNSVRDGIDFRELAQEQSNDITLDRYRNSETGLKLEKIALQHNGPEIICDVSTGRARPLVPESFQRKIFDTLHGLAHPGIRTTRRLISEKFVWYGLSKKVGEWTKECLACQRSKIHKHTVAPLQNFEPPPSRFEHVNVDLVGPLPSSRGFTHLLTIVDRFTRWPEAIPLSSTDSLTVARGFLSNWIARFGLPGTITSDRGSQFTSQLWRDINHLLGIQVNLSTSYHPQANGLVERFHRRLKEALKARGAGPNWTDELPWVLLGIRSAPKEDLNTSSAELVYGTTIRVPGEFFSNHRSVNAPLELKILRDKLGSLKPIPMSHHSQLNPSIHKDLMTSKFVFVRHDGHRKPLQPPYDGPYEVLHHGEKFFKLQIGNRQENVSIDRLKEAHLDIDNPAAPAQPPRRGRPPTKISEPPTSSPRSSSSLKSNSADTSTASNTQPNHRPPSQPNGILKKTTSTNQRSHRTRKKPLRFLNKVFKVTGGEPCGDKERLR
eukprot:TRINITY_DN3386_c0_g1_i3.p1 TRINITY_DN3386_c0_g1~~TRINITY_DN3386_c0_g1_i3.p1  ORF type:complete len:608 (+),score=-10.49 TRINITY_DN3386_c0_g1_i3:209-1825(+)